MNLYFLPKKIKEAFVKCDLENVVEIRLRKGYPIKLILKDRQVYLTMNGASIIKNDAIICCEDEIDAILKSATEYSLYAYNEKIKCGFLSTDSGVRIGLAGECVFDDNKIITIKNYSSLNIRFPHEIYGCSDCFFEKLFDNDIIQNTLIISPPLCGKTTMLKDVARKLDKMNKYNILIVDERGEFISVCGENIDSIKYSTKTHAFEYGIRSLAPQIIITDELGSETDWKCVYNSTLCGVNIIASCHGLGVGDVVNRECFKKNIFDRYVVLSGEQIGKLVSVYDGNLNII